VLNTALALLGSTLAAFAASAATGGGRLNMVHIQNATLAGGVAMGSSANLALPPAAAVALGLLAGAVSTLGFAYVSPALERGLGLKDTCGVHNLHGMPGVLGGLLSALFASLYGGREGNASLMERGIDGQPGAQLAALGCTLAVALSAGAVAGWLTATAGPAMSAATAFEDGQLWVEEEEEEAEGAHAAH
jgi:ammonium transporter Rh